MSKKTSQARYISSAPVHLGESGYYKPGEVFVTDAEPLEEWTPLDAAEAAAIDAADPLTHSAFDIDGADLVSLKGRAAALNLAFPKNASADDLRTLIRAADEPRA